MNNIDIEHKKHVTIYTQCVNTKRGKAVEVKNEIKKLRESTGMNRKEFCEYSGIMSA